MVDRTLYISGQLGLTSSGDMVEGGVTSEAQQVKFNQNIAFAMSSVLFFQI